VNHPGNSEIAVVIVVAFSRSAEERPLDGIMAHPMILCGGNAHATGLAKSSFVYAPLGAQADRHSWSVLQQSHFSSGFSPGLIDRSPRRQPDLFAGAPSVQRSLDEVGRPLSEIVKRPADIVPITTCEELTDLVLMIDQRTPSKNNPFGAPYEIFLGLQTGQVPRRIRATYSVRSGMLSRSLVFTSVIQETSVPELFLGKPHPLPISARPFSLPEMSSDFIVTAAEFVTLDDSVERE
jgi:hypothetical protein